MEVVSYEGINVPLNHQVLSRPIRTRLRRGRYEAYEIRFARSAVRPGDTILDLGAGIGVVGAVLSKTTEAGKIVSVEANPELMAFAQDLHKDNGVENVQLMNCLLTHGQAKTVPFFLRDDFWSSSMDGALPYRDKIDVPAKSFNDMITEIKPQVIVADIEGAEIELFDKRAKLDGVRSIVLEIHPQKTGAKSTHELFMALGNAGYVYDASRAHGQVIRFNHLSSFTS